ncbi:MAG: hypothetical protein WC340_04355 [Kiritimatiellia bacterium]
MKTKEKITRREKMREMVLELQRAASETSTKVTDLLLKALLVARKLKIIDQESWILSELNGYSGEDHNSFPSYRLLGDDIKCYSESYLGVFIAIPSILSEAGCDFYEKQLLRPLYGISVYEIERLLKYSTKNAEVAMPCPPCAEAAVKELTGVPSPITLLFQECSLTGILDAVRAKIYDWASKLEEDGIIVVEPPAQTGARQAPKSRKAVTIKDAAEICGVSASTIKNWEKAKGTPENWPGRTDHMALKSFDVTRKSQAQTKKAIKNTARCGDMNNFSERSKQW